MKSSRGSFCLRLNAAAALIPQTGSPEVPSMEGTLERKQKLQRGGKKVRRDSFGVTPGKAPWLMLLSPLHRRPPEAGAATTPSCTDTPWASTRTGAARRGLVRHAGSVRFSIKSRLIKLLCCRTLQGPPLWTSAEPSVLQPRTTSRSPTASGYGTRDREHQFQEL